MMFSIVGPNTFLIPTSLRLVLMVNDAMLNKPNDAMIIAITEKMVVVAPYFNNFTTRVLHDTLRIPYTILTMRCSNI